MSSKLSYQFCQLVYECTYSGSVSAQPNALRMTQKRKMVAKGMGDDKELLFLAGAIEYELYHRLRVPKKKVEWTHQLICLALGNPKFTSEQKRNCILRIFQSLVTLSTKKTCKTAAAAAECQVDRKLVDGLLKTWVKTVQDETTVLRGGKSGVWNAEVELKLAQRDRIVRETHTSSSELMNRLHFFATIFLCFFGLEAGFPLQETRVGDLLMAEKFHIDSIGTWQQMERIVCLYVAYCCFR